MEITIELKKDITVMAFGFGFDLEDCSFGIGFFYWALTFNFNKLKKQQ